MRTLGICIGASTISVVELESENSGKPVNNGSPHIVSHCLYTHEGALQKNLIAALSEVDMTLISRVAVTGRKFREFINLTTIPEPEAVEYAVKCVKPSH